jgi:Ni,Fe-hydrogenase III small subunit
VLPVDLEIPGCPPAPIDILKGMLALIDGAAGRAHPHRVDGRRNAGSG